MAGLVPRPLLEAVALLLALDALTLALLAAVIFAIPWNLSHAPALKHAGDEKLRGFPSCHIPKAYLLPECPLELRP